MKQLLTSWCKEAEKGPVQTSVMRAPGITTTTTKKNSSVVFGAFNHRIVTFCFANLLFFFCVCVWASFSYCHFLSFFTNDFSVAYS